jgi:WD40 repeat protein
MVSVETGRFVTALNVDCVVAIRPDAGPVSHVALGLYQLMDSELQKRTGAIQIAEIVRLADHVEFRICESVEGLPAVADLCFSPSWDRIVTAFDAASIGFFRYDNEHHLTADGTVALDAVCLSAQWSSDGARIAVGMSSGCAALVDAETHQVESSWQAHTDSCWWAAILSASPTVDSSVWTCSDDATLKRWDVRSPSQVAATLRHDVGVTAVALAPTEHGLLSGSFDERVRLWDLRSVRRPVESLRMAGGVWRLRPHPRRSGVFAVACMHGGAAVLAVAADGTMSAHSPFTAHQTLCYGIDWLNGADATAAEIVSCSFYDNLVCAWTAPLPV